MQSPDTPKTAPSAPAKKARGGARQGGGMQAADGVKTSRVQLTLDAETLAVFKRLGAGNASLGAREAARMLALPGTPGTQTTAGV